MARYARRALLLLVAFMVGCDHATKLAAERVLEGAPPMHVVHGWFDLRYTRNYDVAFSLLRHVDGDWKAHALAALAAIGTLAVAVTWFRRRDVASRFEHWGFAAVLAGAIGNVVDRLTRGYVVDFLELPHWPVFNVADVLVVFGVLALAIGQAKRPRLTAPSR
ncbi:MAG: signal peptidase II [Polyangiaceae bacterium]